MVHTIDRTKKKKKLGLEKSNYYKFSISSFESPVSFMISSIGSPYFFILAAIFFRASASRFCNSFWRFPNLQANI